MFCKNCGKQIEDTAAFCDGCGARTGGGNESRSPASSFLHNMEKKDYRAISIIVCTVVFLLLLIGCFILHFEAGSPAAKIQDTYWDYDKSITIGKAFQKNFENPKWSDVQSGEKPYVEFSGSVNGVLVEIYFIHHSDDDSFSCYGAALDGELLSDNLTKAVMRYGYTGDLQALSDAIDEQLAYDFWGSLILG